VTLLNTLASIRGIEGKTVIVFWEAFLKNFTGSPIIDLVAELGGTINTIYLVINQVPNYIPYSYGSTYLASFLSVFPNIGGVFTEINTYAHYVNSLQGSALGGSFIGELYFNFSYLGVIIAIFVGVLVNKVSLKIEKNIYIGSYFNTAYYAPLFINFLWWPRDAFVSIVRPYFWGAMIIFCVSNIIIRKSNSKCKKL
jgi:hypothetical protein